MEPQPHAVEPVAGPDLRLVPPPDTLPARLCPAGHPNDPSATACRACRRPLGPAGGLVDVAPGALAQLLLEDGSAVAVAADLLIGRCPTGAGEVDTLTVPGRQVSRRHLVVEVRGWRLLVRDCGSTNGTFVSRRDERGRRRVPTDRPVELHLGDTLHFGSRQALVVAVRPA